MQASVLHLRREYLVRGVQTHHQPHQRLGQFVVQLPCHPFPFVLLGVDHLFQQLAAGGFLLLQGIIELLQLGGVPPHLLLQPVLFLDAVCHLVEGRPQLGDLVLARGAHPARQIAAPEIADRPCQPAHRLEHGALQRHAKEGGSQQPTRRR